MRLVSDVAEDEIVFYDLETNHQYAQYASIRLIGAKYGFFGKYEKVEDFQSRRKFKKAMRDPAVLKVGFNCMNFDNIILRRYGHKITEQNCHDGYLMMKAIAPKVPAYSLKFLNWWFLGDPHFAEMELEAWAQQTGEDKWQAPLELLEPYLAWDLEQHANIFKLAWEVVQQPKHWDAYNLDLSNGEVVYEMACKGGLHIDAVKNKQIIARLQHEIEELKEAAEYFSGGAVTNPNSSKQLGRYFDTEGFSLALSANGDFAVRKSDLIDLAPKNDVALAAQQTRKINGSLSFFKNYEKALQDTTYSEPNWIPTSFSISNARTRRFTSNSMYGLNFQNPDKEAKKVQLVPEGWLGFWIDATQIENVVHIYESEDDIRRRAYESDPEWSEYVWLCNRILGCSKTKDELDAIDSPQVPNWSVYKQFKTAKLALNFGMGVTKFCKTTGVSPEIGWQTFNEIHEACPAIRSLQEKVRRLVTKNGYVQDVFGHCYEDAPRNSYKLVAYLVQGCGTGSLPKAQMRSNFDTIHSYDGNKPAGHLCTTTHDENSGRLRLNLGEERLLAILQEMLFNMTEKFSLKFDNIPLRAKMYLSTTTNSERTEIKNLTKQELRKILK